MSSKKKKPTKRPTAAQQKRKKAEANWKRYVTNQLKKNPKASANEMMRNYKKKHGTIGIGNEKAKEIIRSKKGVELDIKKSTKFTAKTVASHMKNYLSKWTYIFTYKIDENGSFVSDTCAVTSETKISKARAYEEAINMLSGLTDGFEYYKDRSIILSSIKLIQIFYNPNAIL